MRYDKPALTFEQQAEQLIQRGLQADKQTLIDRLEAVSYYRLSGYLYPFRVPGRDEFHPGTSLDKVWRRYTFDRRLRLIVLDAIERVEVAIRTQCVYAFAHKFGPFGYTVRANLPGLRHDGNRDEHADLLNAIRKNTKQSREPFVEHFEKKYGSDHPDLPLWMAAELMTFGTLLTFVRGLPPDSRKNLAGQYKVPEEVLLSWLKALNSVRNICAHHGRLWNRELGYQPRIPKKRKNPQWHVPSSMSNQRIFAVLTILKYLTNAVAPQSAWPQRLREILGEYPEIPSHQMGFPENWEIGPIWQ